MKSFTILFILLLYFSSNEAQGINEKDTIYLNFNLRYSGYGAKDKGILLYSKNDLPNALLVEYNEKTITYIINNCRRDNTIKLPNTEKEWEDYYEMADSLSIKDLLDFYQVYKHNYQILKPEFVLTELQLKYIYSVIQELKIRPVEKDIYSNMTDYYTVITPIDTFIYVDRTGNWDKYNEIFEIMGLNNH